MQQYFDRLMGPRMEQLVLLSNQGAILSATQFPDRASSLRGDMWGSIPAEAKRELRDYVLRKRSHMYRTFSCITEVIVATVK